MLGWKRNEEYRLTTVVHLSFQMEQRLRHLAVIVQPTWIEREREFVQPTVAGISTKDDH
jgi:hypothetical protein